MLIWVSGSQAPARTLRGDGIGKGGDHGVLGRVVHLGKERQRLTA